ncbi:MAG TPA: hypothetical protein VE619_11220 [Nitrososphaeraceae archaeon]|nr:hypothetical protein [Nitrososphaeraceae archaeon]
MTAGDNVIYGINGRGALNYFLEWASGDIVILCLTGARYDDFLNWMNGLSPTILKKYLFYLIDYDFILYNGQKQVYVTKDKG